MKTALIADVHVGNHRTLGGTYAGRLNARCLETISVLRQAVSRATDLGCVSIVVLGDLFDTDNPSPQMVAATKDALCSGSQILYLLLGNHEQHSTYPNDHALASIRDDKRIFVIDSATNVNEHYFPTEMIMIPFQPGAAETWFEDEVEKVCYSSQPKSVCFHLGVSDASTEANQPWMMNSHDQIHVDYLQKVMNRFGISHAFAGNWHKHQTWNNNTIIQTGALVPTGWNNPGLDDSYGSLIVFDGNTVERHVITGPRYVKFQSVEDWKKYASIPNLRARIEVDVTQAEQTSEFIFNCQVEGHVEIVPVDKSRNKIIQNIVQEVRSSELGLTEYIHRTCSPAADVESVVMKYIRNNE